MTDDGTQLCVVQTSPWETLISLFDITTGKEADSITLAGNLTHINNNHVLYRGSPIQFMRGGEYILLDGQLLVHKKTGRIVWSLSILPTEDQYQLTNNAERRVAGDVLFVADGPHNFPELRTLKIPFAEIESALAVVAAGGPATVGPQNAEVALDIDVTTVRFGSVEETKKELSSTLTDRLSAEGLKVVDGASAVLSLQYAEGAGNTLSISKFQPGIPRSQQNQQPAGPGLESTRALMQLALKINNKAVWTKVIELDPRFMIIRGDATAQSARDNVFEHVQQSLYGIPVVWYVSQEKPYVTLPMLDSFQCQATEFGGRRPTRRPGAR